MESVATKKLAEKIVHERELMDLMAAAAVKERPEKEEEAV